MSAAKRQHRQHPGGPWRAAVVGAVVLVVTAGAWLFFNAQRRAHGSSYGLNHGAEVYAGSGSCQECHQEEFKLWAASHHGLAQGAPKAADEDGAFSQSEANQGMSQGGVGLKTPIGPDSKSAPKQHRLADGDTWRAADRTTRVRKQGTGFEALTLGLNNTQQLFRVEGVLGVSPLRQFLVDFPGGRLQTLEASYDPRSNEWFSVFGAEQRQPGEWGHWTGRGMNWNSMCASCHNTGLRKNYDQTNDTYHTTMVESGVGCEACHGPLRAHVDWQRRFGKSGRKDPTVAKWPVARVVDNCGFCHARRGDLAGDFKPGTDFFDHMRLEIPDGSGLFYADGQVHEEDYEYAAFLGSRMHARGVSCGDCHNPHSAKTLLPGNWLCMRCHNGSYTNAPIIDPVGHSHHTVFGYAPNGVLTNTDLSLYRRTAMVQAGGECVNCHMPQTVYMQRHWRHDHGFTTPDPLLTKEAGVPNACNRCHRDKDAEWALRYCDAWYGSKMDRPSRQRTRLIVAARKHDPSAWPGLTEMLATNDLAYWRAVAAALLQPWAEKPPVRGALLRGLQDTNSLVRSECVHALEPLAESPEVADALRRCLADPVRDVRVGAAWALRARLDLASVAGRDLLHGLSFNADQPAGQMQLGAFDLARGDASQAAVHYEKAAEWDPDSAVIRHDYAVVLATLQRPQEAVEQLQAACRLEPANAEFRYKLALGWNELGQSTKVIECLQQAVRLDPGLAPAWYNLGLALSGEGRTEEALGALSRAESADASDPRSAYARGTILAQMGRFEEARRAVQRALELEPDFKAAQELMQRLAAVK